MRGSSSAFPNISQSEARITFAELAEARRRHALKMAEGVDAENTWLIELETALFTESDFNVVRKITNGKPVPQNLRPSFWQVCLGVKGKLDKTMYWDDMFNLPEQTLIRADCQKLVDRLGNDEEDKVSVISDLESVLTNYCKVTGKSYDSGNGWLEVIEPLIALRLSKWELYNCFYAIQSMYIPRYCDKNGHLFHLLRLLLLYHDPELCSFLDTKKITPEAYSIAWFQSLFSATCDLNVILTMWDIYFQLADPFFIFFLGLVILVNAKEQILSMKGVGNQEIIDILASAPCALEAEDIEDFCSLAKFYASRTPQSFCKDYHVLIFGTDTVNKADEVNLSQALCLPVSVHELLLNNRLDVDKGSNVHFFVVDCRPAEQYNAGYLSTAFHLDSSLMLQEPTAFKTAVQALLAAQRQAISAGSVAGGEHLCFMGSGREEEDQYLHMVIASFLQKHLQYVSIAKGGYAALHELLLEDALGGLTNHNPKACIVCNPSATSSSASGTEEDEVSLIDKLAIAVKNRSAVMKDILVEYITNPHMPVEERHVSSTDRTRKRYRGMAPIFSIDDDQEDGVVFASDDEIIEEVNLQQFLKKPEVLAYFKCDELKDNAQIHPCHLVVHPTHLFVLRDNSSKKGNAFIVSRRSLSSIIKITSKRKNAKVITFKYGHVHENTGDFEVTAIDRLIIPEAVKATNLIKDQILQLRDKTDNC